MKFLAQVRIINYQNQVEKLQNMIREVVVERAVSER